MQDVMNEVDFGLGVGYEPMNIQEVEGCQRFGGGGT